MESLREILSRTGMQPRPSAGASSTSSASPEPPDTWDCPVCKDAGFLVVELPVGHPDYGKTVPCECRLRAMRRERVDQLIQRSNLGPLRRMTFDGLAASGPSTDPAVQRRFAEATAIARRFAERPEGWLVFAGASGSGKTHLAAAIANQLIDGGTAVLFMVVADLLDHLRAAFSPQADTDYDELFDDMRNFPVLVLDDIGAQAATPWAEEKLYQILNHRSNAQLPTVITSSLPLARLDDRVRTRLNDASLVTVVDLSDLRDQADDDLDILGTRTIASMTFETFEVERLGLESRQRISLATALRAARSYAEHPDGWLVFFGGVGVGKTHLAAAIANYRAARGEPVRFVVVPDLLDHLRAAYAPDARITYDTLSQRTRAAPLLVLDDFGTQSSTDWAREKLFQIINYRYNDRLPTVFTTSAPMDELWRLFPAVASRMADITLSTLIAIDAPDHRSGEPTRPTMPAARSRNRGRRD